MESDRNFQKFFSTIIIHPEITLMIKRGYMKKEDSSSESKRKR